MEINITLEVFEKILELFLKMIFFLKKIRCFGPWTFISTKKLNNNTNSTLRTHTEEVNIAEVNIA